MKKTRDMSAACLQKQQNWTSIKLNLSIWSCEYSILHWFWSCGFHY